MVPVGRKLFVEFGVEDYTEANTRFLLVNDNWAGLVMDGSEANVARMRDLALRSPSLVTALAPFIGYDRAAVIAKSMVANGLTIEEAARRELGDAEWDALADDVSLERMAHPHAVRDGQDHDPSGP